MMRMCGCSPQHAVTLETPEAPARYAATQTVAEVSRDATALATLQRLGINHCCGAHLTLTEAAAAAGVKLDTLLDALNRPAA